MEDRLYSGAVQLGSSSQMSDHRPRVSVILPTYNRAHYLEEAICSVLCQTFHDFELIVIDDGSTDNTADVLAFFDDPRLHVIVQKNLGRSRARNAGLRTARGSYIAFLDSDDLYLPHKLEQQVKFLDENTSYGMVYTPAACIDDDEASLAYVYPAPVSGRIYPQIAFFKPLTITLPTVMLRSEVLEEVGHFDDNMERFEDTDLWRRVSKHFLIGKLDEATCLVRTHSGNELRTQDAAGIEAAVEYYVAKAFREDSKDIDPHILQAGARRLFRHYGHNMRTVPAFVEIGERLLRRGRRHFEPKVSIVIPVYNGGNYLEQAIRSALAQTYWNVEIIIVNDGSEDGGVTEAIAHAFGERVKYLSQPNRGVASALNSGFRSMSGEYFSWLSHDDLYLPEKIERQVEFLSEQPEPQNCIVYSDHSVFQESPCESVEAKLPHVAPEDFRFFITTQNVLHSCTLLVPRSALERNGGFNERLRTTQDYDLWFRIAQSYHFIHQPGTLVLARSHAEQGTLKLNTLVQRECDELLATFITSLSPDEICRGCSTTLLAGYLSLVSNMYSRGFEAAAQRALELGRRAALDAPDPENLSLAAADLVYRFGFEQLRKLESERLWKLESEQSLHRTLELRHDFEQRLQQSRQQILELQQECDGLRTALEELHSSSSWRITAPLRKAREMLERQRN